MYLQGVDNVFDLEWTKGVTYGDIHLEDEKQFSKYNFEAADVAVLIATFSAYEAEGKRLITQDLVLPAYDCCMKTSHLFNLLDARGAISVAERTTYIARVRGLARLCAESYSSGKVGAGKTTV
jgi:glycyl-tRNA synthetase alpha chain